MGTTIVNKRTCMCLSWVMLRGVGSYDHLATNEEGILSAHLDPAWYGRTTCTQTEDCEAQSDSETTDRLGAFLVWVPLQNTRVHAAVVTRFEKYGLELYSQIVKICHSQMQLGTS